MTRKHAGDNAFTAESLYGTIPEPMYAGALSFARRKYTRDLAGVDLAITGIPFDTATTNRPGARFGPRAIRAASVNLAWERHWPWDFDPFDRLAVVDYGDCLFDHGRPQGVPDAIERHVRTILASGAGALTLGGDHFVTYPVLKAHAAKYGTLSLLHFDAHSDTWGDEDGRIDHGTMFYHAARDGIVDPERSVQVGLRTTNDETLGFEVLDAHYVHAQAPAKTALEIREVIGDAPVYVTFDIDCLDPAFAPGTGTPVCGGLSTAQALGILHGLSGLPVVGMDVMEVAPAYDVGEITALAAATLAYELVCLVAVARGATNLE